MGYAGIKRDRPSQLTQAISTAYPPLGNNFHQHPPPSREHKGRGGIEHAESVYVAFGHLPLTSCTRLSCCDLSRLLRSASRSLTRFAATVMASAAALERFNVFWNA